MRNREKAELIAEVTRKIRKKGIPINVRTGGNEEAAEYFRELLQETIRIDEPLGVLMGVDYDYCPICSGIVGTSAYYCKKCGAYLRGGGTD